jgi:hypothetical protein
MSDNADDGYDCFRRLAKKMRLAGFSREAGLIDSRFKTAWTTSSELIGELGSNILAFEKERRDLLDSELRHSIDECMAVVRKIWPDIRS